MKVNSALSAESNIYAQIKETNPSANPSALNVILGLPVVGSFVTANGTKNTSLDISSIKNKGYSGVRTIYYDRLALPSNVKSGAFGTYMAVGSPSLAAVRAGICAQMGLLESELTWNSAVVPTGGAQINFIATVKANSLVYNPGSTLTVPVLHCTAVTEFNIISGNSNNTDAGGGLTNRGIRGWCKTGLGLSVPAGSLAGGSVMMGSYECIMLASPNFISGDGEDYTLKFCIGGQFNGSTPAPRSLVKKLEIITEGTGAMYFEQLYGASNGYAEGINTSFPSRYDFLRGAVPRLVAGTTYRIRIYRM